jgi:hypothetical protein
MGHGGADIVGIEPAVEANAFRELLHAAIRRLIKDTTPGLVGQSLFLGVDAAGGAFAAKEIIRANIFTLNGLRQAVNARWAVFA